MALPSKFGPAGGIDSKDYLFKMQTPGGYATDPLTTIIGHSLTSPSQNLTDVVTYDTVELQNGRIVPVTRTKRAAQEVNRNYTIGFPSAIWTPVVEASLRQGCISNFFLIYLCPEDAIYEHWDILAEALLNPPVEAEDVITTGQDTNIITQTAEMTVTKKLRGYGLGFSPIYDAGSVAYHDIVFTEELCQGCGGGFAQSMIAGGGDGTAIPLVTLTPDRFTTTTALVTGGAATNVIDALYTKGDFIVAAMHVTAAPTVGIVRVSYDGGSTWAVITDIPEVIFDIIDADGTLILVGGDSTDGGRVYISEDRLNSVTEVLGSAIPASTALNAAAYDKETGRVYIAGQAGVLLVGRKSGSSFTLTDISSNLNGSPGNLRCVLVRSKNEVVVGGASGYLSQSRDGGTTWESMGSPTSGTIESMAGNQWRIIIASTTNLYEASALTDNAFEAVVLENGATVSGNYQKLRMNNNDDFNRFVGVTDAGEVVLATPFYPSA